MTVGELVKRCNRKADFRIVGEYGHDFDEVWKDLPILMQEVIAWDIDDNGVLIIETRDMTDDERYMTDDDIPF